MITSEQGLNLIKHYESLHDGDLSMIGLQPKMCPAGIWTEGYGHAMYYSGHYLNGEEEEVKAINLSTIKTEQDAVRVLKYDLQKIEKILNSLKLSINQSQFDAIISFTYNVGYHALYESTLLRRIVMGTDSNLIKDAFMMWVKCKGKVLKGLTYRRQSEATLYTTGELKFYN